MTTPSPSAGDPARVDAARLVEAHHHARRFYRQQLLRADGPRRYLTQRGLGVLTPTAQPGTPGVDWPWYLGYAPPGWTTLADHLTQLGYTPTELVAAGLATPTRNGRVVDTFRDRIVFPIHNPDGQPVAFIARAAPNARTDTPKYLNTCDTAIYHKGHTLYGLSEQRDRVAAGAAPTLVEGPTDVLAIWLTHPDPTQTGRIAVAACGTNLTQHHAATIAAMPGAARHGITTALDNDPAGRQATQRAWHLLAAHPTLTLHAANLPDGADPADLITDPTSTALLHAGLNRGARPLAHAVIDIHLDRLIARRPDLLRHIEGRLHAARILASLLTDLPTEQIITLTAYIAHHTDAGLDTVTDAVITNLERAAPPKTRGINRRTSTEGGNPAPPLRNTPQGSGFPPLGAAATNVAPPPHAGPRGRSNRPAR